jgi:hypothetical protein
MHDSFYAFALLPSHSLGISVNKPICCGSGRRRIFNQVKQQVGGFQKLIN